MIQAAVKTLEAENAALREQLADREKDLEFEHNARVEAEEEAEHLRDNADCEAGVLFDDLRQRIAELETVIHALDKVTDSDGNYVCAWCNKQWGQHSPDCLRQKVLNV